MVREHKHCPRTRFLTNRGSDCPFNFFFLSSKYSCSNELNHISDATEDHEHGLNYLLRNYLLSSFLLSFSKSLPVSSSPSDLSLSLNLPHHNIVCLSPTDRPFCPKIQNSKTFLLPLHSPLHIIFPTISPSSSQNSLPDLLQNVLLCLPFRIALSSPSHSQTAILHNCITDPSHNLEPPPRRHTHSVQPSCKSLNTSPKKQQSFPCRSKEKAAATQKQNGSINT
jgi:hypothetical protein